MNLNPMHEKKHHKMFVLLERAPSREGKGLFLSQSAIMFSLLFHYNTRKK